MTDRSDAVPASLPFTRIFPANQRDVFPQFPQRASVRAFLTTSDGRDSALRLLQYSLRLCVQLRHKRYPWLAHLLVTVSFLSAVRRIVSLLELAQILVRLSGRLRSRRAKGKGKATDERSTSTSGSDQQQRGGILKWSVACYFTREVLDVVSTGADAFFLFGTLKIIPVSRSCIKKSDRASDWAALVSSSLGLMQVVHSRREIWREGRGVQREIEALTLRLEQFRTHLAEGIPEGSEVEDEDWRELERKAKEKIRGRRRTLKKLRGELDELAWERIRLVAEGVFAGYDALELKTGSDVVRSWAGIVSASIVSRSSSSSGPSTPLTASVKAETSRQSSSTPMELDSGAQSMSISSSGDSKGKGREIVEHEQGDDGETEALEAARLALEKAEVAHLGEQGKVDEKEEILLGTMPKAKTVGLPNYRGIATLKKGQDVELRRDHLNISDKNAIEVRHPDKGIKIGMVNKSVAQKLAPLLDARLIELEGVANDVPSHTVMLESVEFTIKIWGTRAIGRDARLDFLFPLRSKRKADDAEAARRKARGEEVQETEPSNGDPSKKLDAIIKHSEYDRPGTDLLAELFQEGASDPATLPVHPCPPGRKDKTMRSDLMTFQKQGLAWMIKMEHPLLPNTPEDPPVQLWMKKVDAEGEQYWYNLGTETSQREKPILKRGGILADSMGLGKTMQTIALIVTDDTGQGVLDDPEEPDERYDDMTLIVCPLSVASNWTDQFHTHVGSKRLSWHLYHGEGRNVSKKQLRKFDVVITTYQTLAAEHNASLLREDEPEKKKVKLSKAKEGVLHSIKWRRAVLDEGHLIKNPRAKMSMACAILKAERRWILTGTPIINSTTDLGAMMSFLKMCRPLDQKDQWTKCVERRSKTPEGAQLLRAIVSSTTLRRTKEMHDSSGQLLVSLPEIKFYLHKIKLTPEARVLYDEIAAELAVIVKKLLADGRGDNHYSTVLVFLLRLRQLACDPALCPQSFIDKVHEHRLAAEVAAASTKAPSLDTQETSRLRGLLRQIVDEGGECMLCHELLEEPRITTCEHFFCDGCITPYVKKYLRCPIDSDPLTMAQIIEPAVDETDSTADEAEVLARQQKEGATASAAKTAELINILDASEAGVKSLVFSQWTSHLNCIEASLSDAGISTCRFDGSMTQQKREKIIASFSAPPPKKPKPLKKGEKGPPTVMLISLKAGALGLNLTCASQVFLMDPWWQASIEHQAIDRVYRIGQTKPVRVFQLVAEDTVEDRVLDIQKTKQELVSQAFSANKAAIKEPEPESETPKPKSRMEDMKTIFGV